MAIAIVDRLEVIGSSSRAASLLSVRLSTARNARRLESPVSSSDMARRAASGCHTSAAPSAAHPRPRPACRSCRLSSTVESHRGWKPGLIHQIDDAGGTSQRVSPPVREWVFKVIWAILHHPEHEQQGQHVERFGRARRYRGCALPEIKLAPSRIPHQQQTGAGSPARDDGRRKRRTGQGERIT